MDTHHRDATSCAIAHKIPFLGFPIILENMSTMRMIMKHLKLGPIIFKYIEPQTSSQGESWLLELSTPRTQKFNAEVEQQLFDSISNFLFQRKLHLTPSRIRFNMIDRISCDLVRTIGPHIFRKRRPLLIENAYRHKNIQSVPSSVVVHTPVTLVHPSSSAQSNSPGPAATQMTQTSSKRVSAVPPTQRIYAAIPAPPSLAVSPTVPEKSKPSATPPKKEEVVKPSTDLVLPEPREVVNTRISLISETQTYALSRLRDHNLRGMIRRYLAYFHDTDFCLNGETKFSILIHLSSEGLPNTRKEIEQLYFKYFDLYGVKKQDVEKDLEWMRAHLRTNQLVRLKQASDAWDSHNCVVFGPSAKKIYPADLRSGTCDPELCLLM